MSSGLILKLNQMFSICTFNLYLRLPIFYDVLSINIPIVRERCWKDRSRNCLATFAKTAVATKIPQFKKLFGNTVLTVLAFDSPS